MGLSVETLVLAKKYTDEQIDNVSSSIPPDWNQNDETALDYIKNRPFYSTGEYEYTEIVNEEPLYMMPGRYYIMQSALLIEGQLYQVIINKNQEFLFTAESNNTGMTSVGNANTNWGEGYPFSVFGKGGVLSIWSDTTFNINHIIINEAKEIIKCLDKKYISNHIVGEKFEGKEVVYNGQSYISKQGAEVFNIGNKAIGTNSHAEGSSTLAVGDSSHAEGSSTLAIGTNSHAEGYMTESIGTNSHAEGYMTIANAPYLHVQGKYNLPEERDTYSVSYAVSSSYPKYDGETVVYLLNDKPNFDGNEGIFTLVSEPVEICIKDLQKGNYFLFSKPESDIIDTYYYTSELISQETNEEAGTTLYQWKYTYATYNKNIYDGLYTHIVGNGTSQEHRSNAHTLDWDGNAWYAGDIYVGSTSGTNKDEGSKKLATEDFVNEQVNNLIIVSEEEPADGTLWIDKDANEEIILAEIDDNVIDTEKTWSSSKINEEVSGLNENLFQLKQQGIIVVQEGNTLTLDNGGGE